MLSTDPHYWLPWYLWFMATLQQNVMLNRHSLFGSAHENIYHSGLCCRDLVKIALTVPSGNPVLSAIFRSFILAGSCFASVANIEIISSLNGPVESNPCS